MCVIEWASNYGRCYYDPPEHKPKPLVELMVVAYAEKVPFLASRPRDRLNDEDRHQKRTTLAYPIFPNTITFDMNARSVCM